MTHIPSRMNPEQFDDDADGYWQAWSDVGPDGKAKGVSFALYIQDPNSTLKHWESAPSYFKFSNHELGLFGDWLTEQYKGAEIVNDGGDDWTVEFHGEYAEGEDTMDLYHRVVKDTAMAALANDFTMYYHGIDRFTDYILKLRDDMFEALANTYGPKALALLTRIRQFCQENGLYVPHDPYDMSGDDYRYSLIVYRSKSDDDGNMENAIDVSIEIAESREYDDDSPTGINFGLDIVEAGGRMLGGLSPYNYTDECWVDAYDTEAVAERWQLMENADISAIPNLITETKQ